MGNILVVERINKIMKIDYKRDIHHQYLILTEGSGPDTASYQIRMLMHNRIEGFLECSMQQMDENVLFYYDVTSRQPLSLILEQRQLKVDLLRLLLERIMESLSALNEYLLSPDGLFLNEEYIYLDPTLKEIYFCYFPMIREAITDQAKRFSEYLLTKLDHADRKALVICYDFYQKTMDETLTPEMLSALLHSGGQAEEFGDRQYKPKQNGQENREYLGNALRDDGMVWEKQQRTDHFPTNREELLDAFLGPDPQDEKKKNRLRSKKYKTKKRQDNRKDKKDRSENDERNEKNERAERTSFLGRYLPGIFSSEKESMGSVLHTDERKCKAGGDKIREADRYRKKPPKKDSVDKAMEQYLDLDWMEANLNIVQQTSSSDNKETLLLHDDFFEDIGIFPKQGKEKNGMEKTAWLVSETTGKRYRIKDDITLVGKKSSHANLILDSAAVSRLHARILLQSEGYKIYDLNSKNGTYLNDRLLEEKDGVLLRNEDKIRFADEEFIFRDDVLSQTY